ncbi:MAG: biopolymer transporter ExbD [Candidatus Omnitrophota bacterium]
MRHSCLKPIKAEYTGIAPFLNLFLLLFLFFVLIWGYAASSNEGIGVILPKAVTSRTVAGDSLILTITREKLIYINGGLVSLKELALRLKDLPARSSLLIKADKGTPLERVVEVWDICKQAGIGQVNLATTQAK